MISFEEALKQDRERRQNRLNADRNARFRTRTGHILQIAGCIFAGTCVVLGQYEYAPAGVVLLGLGTVIVSR